MATPRILSVGIDPLLMVSRTLLLRNAGYSVVEAHSVDKAISIVESDSTDSIDLTLICHTLPKSEKKWLIAVVREKRRLMPILYIQPLPFASAPRTCI